MLYNIKAIAANFCIQGAIETIVPFGSGHINDSFRIKVTDPDLPGYLLQRVNHYVFQNVPALMDNVNLVTAHLKNKLLQIPGSNPVNEVLTIARAKNNELFFRDADGNYWRMYLFLQDTKSYDEVHTEKQAYEGGKAFGKFQLLLADLDAGLLFETIPGFHDVSMRLGKLNNAVSADVKARVKEVLPELEFLNERVDKMTSILNLGKEGKLPLRIIHNDTKFNNILLDRHDHAQCVIDLDTVMPGYVAYDFGDAIRTIINTAPEDESDLSKINLNIPLFKAYTEGYFKSAHNFLTSLEIEMLVTGVLLIPYTQSVRFLTDYIAGDVYYKTHFASHNLQRTRAQLQLLKRLEEQYALLDQIIQEVSNTYRSTASK